MEENSSKPNENSAGEDIQIKNSIGYVTSPEILITAETDSIPKSGTCRTSVTGLLNPAFVFDDGGNLSLKPKQDLSQIIGYLQVPSAALAPTSFSDFNAYSFTSQTTLCHKDSNHNSAGDAEKGSPSTETDVNPNLSEKVEYTGLKKYIGLLLTLSTSFCLSIVVLFVKILKDYGFNPYGASFWRYTGTVIPSIPLLLYYECGPGEKKHSTVFEGVWPITENQNWKIWIGLFSRGVIGSTSVILRYYALQYLTIADTSVITYSTPVLVTILAHFFLGERCGIFPIFISILTLCGIVIVTKPQFLTGATGFDSDTMIGSAFAIGSLICSALLIIITRTIRKVHFTLSSTVFGTIGVAQALILICFMGHFNMPTQLFDSLLVAGVGSLSFLGQISIILALKFENAGPVALIRSCDVLFGFLFQYIFLNVIPDAFSACGAVIVLFGVVSTGFRKWLDTLPKEDKRRETWSFILK